MNDPLLVSSFADLVSKFESCALNFQSTANRVLAKLGSQSQLELSASTRAFSSGPPPLYFTQVSSLLIFQINLIKLLFIRII